MKLAFYGGSFNPPHIGHLHVVVQVLAFTNVDKVLVAPVFKHPDGKDLVDYEHRIQMCEKLIEPVGSHRVVVSDVEKQANKFGAFLTADTLRYIFDTKYFSPEKVYLVVGGDIDVEHWQGYSEIREWISQGKVEVFHSERVPGTSSTHCRRLLKQGIPCDGLLTNGVADYIRQKELYL